MTSERHITIGIVIRIAAVMFCGYILIRCHVDFAMASRMVSQSARDLREATSTVDIPRNLDTAVAIINRSLHPLALATLALVLLGIFPYANLKWRRKTEPTSAGDGATRAAPEK